MIESPETLADDYFLGMYKCGWWSYHYSLIRQVWDSEDYQSLMLLLKRVLYYVANRNRFNLDIKCKFHFLISFFFFLLNFYFETIVERARERLVRGIVSQVSLSPKCGRGPQKFCSRIQQNFGNVLPPHFMNIFPLWEKTGKKRNWAVPIWRKVKWEV